VQQIRFQREPPKASPPLPPRRVPSPVDSPAAPPPAPPPPAPPVSSDLAVYPASAPDRDATIERLQRRGQDLQARTHSTEDALIRLRADTAVQLTELRRRAHDARAVVGAIASPSALRVLYVTTSWDAPYRYRCQHCIEQLRQAGVAANVMHV